MRAVESYTGTHVSHPVRQPNIQRPNCMALMRKNGARISPAAFDIECGFMAR